MVFPDIPTVQNRAKFPKHFPLSFLNFSQFFQEMCRKWYKKFCSIRYIRKFSLFTCISSFMSLFSLSLSSLYPLTAPFLNPLSFPSPPSLLIIIFPPKIKTSSFITFCFTNGTFFCILFHTRTYFFNNAFYKLVNTTF